MFFSNGSREKQLFMSFILYGISIFWERQYFYLYLIYCNIANGFGSVTEEVGSLNNAKIEQNLSDTLELQNDVLLDTDLGTGFNKDSKLWEVIVKYSGNIMAVGESLGVEVEVLSNTYAIITLPEEKIDALVTYKQVEYLERPKNLGLMVYTGMQNSCITQVQDKDRDGLSGKGVLVAIIDSGIDYRHKDFRNPDGTTRIAFLWDQTIEGNPPNGFKSGSEYSAVQINEALAAGDKGYEIVPSRDNLGHGTTVAGIAAGNGLSSNDRNVGAAPESTLLIVKIGIKGNESFARTTEMMRAVKYAVDKASGLEMPVAINISFGSNDGAHDGNSLFETFLGEMAQEWKNVIVVASGNEGAAGHHFEGIIAQGETGVVEFTTSPGLNYVYLSTWKYFVDIMSFELVAPNGKSTGRVGFADQIRQFALNNQAVYIFFGQPNFYTVGQEIRIQILARPGEFINEGVWKLLIYGDSIVVGNINIWLPITEAVSDRTAFLVPSVQTTLTIPSTTRQVITVGGYNSQINSVSNFSGRGFTYGLNIVKPDLVAPAENILTTAVGGSYDVFSGTSMAAPHVTGGAALLMEWGIVQGNDPFLYGQRIKAYLQLGAKRDSTITYPNPAWGYGKLCVANSLNYLKEYNFFNVFTQMSPRNSFEQEILKTQQLEVSPTVSEIKIQAETQPEGRIQFIVQASSIVLSYLSDHPYITVEQTLNNIFVILSMPIDRISQFLKEIGFDISAESEVPLGLMGKMDLEVSGITAVQNQPFLDLMGQGVMVGFADTGIDYRNKAFINADGTSRIVCIWDQTIDSGTPPDGYNFGSVYYNEDINRALQSDDPYSIVPHRDDNGHGTFLASVACSNEKDDYLGAAPLSEIAVVKLRKINNAVRNLFALPDDAEAYSSTDLMMGVDFIRTIGESRQQPTSICIGMGTNCLGHDGTSLFEFYLSTLCSRIGLCVTIAAGNESNARHHTAGKLANQGDEYPMEIKVGENTSGFIIYLWNYSQDRISVSITSPTGETLRRIPAVSNSTFQGEFVLEKSRVIVSYVYPTALSASQLTLISIYKPTPGIWTITLYGEIVLIGTFDAWLPITNFIPPDTYFLSSTPDDTVTVPSTASGVICTGAYSALDGSIYVASSRGNSRFQRRLPTLVAPGVNVKGIFPTGYGTMTGTSVSAAITAGAAALMLQWGIVEKNQIAMNTISIFSYLTKGCRRKPELIYPNRIWGFGELDLYNTFQVLRQTP